MAKKKDIYKIKPLNDNKRNIIQSLIEEYDIETAEDIDAHRKMVSRLGLAHVVEHRQHLGGRDILGGEPIAPGVDGRMFGAADHRGCHVFE